MNEVATDYNAGFTSAVARMVQEYGGTALTNFPPAETPGTELMVEAAVNASGNNFLEVKASIKNQSAWPARGLVNGKLRYFFTLDGRTPAELSTQASYNQCENAPSGPVQYADDVYYVEIDCSGTVIYPGGQQEYRKEVQFRISTTGSWDNANDWSYEGVSTAAQSPSLAPKIVLYDGNRIVWGQEPNGDGVEPLPTRTPTVAPTGTPTGGPTSNPTGVPTSSPTPNPVVTPIPAPTAEIPACGTENHVSLQQSFANAASLIYLPSNKWR